MVELDELLLTVVVDNETDTLSSIDNAVQASEATGLVGRLEPTSVVDGHPATTVFGHLCCACHGYSVLATGRVGDEARTVLFDVGPYADVWLANAERLGIDLATIGTVFLSHWHWDHSGALPEVVAAIAEARRTSGLPRPVLDLHPDRPDQRGTRLPDGRILLLPPEPTLDELMATGAEVVLHGNEHDPAGGWFHASGQVPRRTAFETGLAGHGSIHDGAFQPDPLILDERYVAARVAGRGVTVLSACSHAGIINVAADAAARLDRPLDLVLGGYHLAGKVMEERIPDTVAALVDLGPRLVAPGHCTGWRAKAALAGAFSPSGSYAPSVVGTRYRLAAP
jgi:7,8-dihydropterin-6-yl-methyl-4-(beta-D-ribofuranosyl)aminobenzene 5'-phosphate synthase